MGRVSLLRYAALLLIVCATVQAQIWEEVLCERMESCECTGNTGSPDPICHFTLIVNQSHTFTRYFLDDEGNPGFGGRVMYFQTSRPEPSATSPSPSASPSPDGIPTDYPPEPNERMSCDGTNDKCTDAITVDGNNFRAVITVNGRFPAPTLIVPYNAVVVVDVNNELDSESTSIHWHGMHQMNTPWMDGVEHITQCGIPPASSFRYIFRAFPAGTHWYHSHSGAQRTDGLFGALIVKESDGIKPMVESVVGRSFMDMPQNHTLTLIDWQPKNSLELFTQLHSGIRFYDQFTVPSPGNDQRIRRTCSPDGIEVGPVNFWSGLINGRGRHREINYDQTYLSVFTIPSRDQRYRFRLIGAQGLYAFRFSIDEHRLLLIATDGHFVMPTMVDFIIIHSGERYDFIPQIRDPSKSDYIIRAETLEVPMRCERLGPNQLFENHLAEAILHYGDGGDIPSNGKYQRIVDEAVSNDKWCRMNEGCVAVNCPFENFPSQYGITNCISVDELRVLPNTVSEADPMVYTTDEDKTIFFNFGFEGDSSTSTINGRNFRFPSEPLQLINNRPIPSACGVRDNDNERCSMRTNRLVTEECRCTHVRQIDPDQTYRFVFTAVGPNIADWNFSHPVHLHGHSFRVTKIGFGRYDNNNENVNDNGRIIESSADINCGQSDTYCTTPTWTADPERMLRGETITDAPYKDTVLVPAGGYAVVYFRSNNPGYWFLHCHIETHQLEGMAVVINEAPERHNAPPKDIGQCQPFTWSVYDFLNRERSPSRALQLPNIEYNTLFTLFTISAGIGGAFIVLFVLLLSIIACVTCFYCYCK